MEPIPCEAETFPHIRQFPDPSEKRQYISNTTLERYSYGHMDLALSYYVCALVQNAFSEW